MSDSVKKLLFAAFFLFITYGIWKQNFEKSESRQWPSTTGKIIKSSVESGQDWRGNSTWGHYYTNYFTLATQYEYSVDGVKYTGHRIKVTEMRYGSESSARQDLESYKEGKTVDVYYNPKKPDSCVLVPSI